MASQSETRVKSTVERIKVLLAARYTHSLKALLDRQHPADMAHIIELLDEDDRARVFELMREELAAEVLDRMNTNITRDLVDAIPDEKIANILEAMPMDEAAEVLSELEDDRLEEILALMEPEEAANVETLLGHEEDTAGRLMSTEVVKLKASWTVQQTLKHLRSLDPDVETLAYLYVVNNRDALVGVVPLRKLITAPPQKKLAGIMQHPVISVTVDTDQEEVARIVAEYDFFAVPIVDSSGRLVGIITHDDVVDILREEFTEDLQRLGGSEPLEEPYLTTPILTIVRKRAGGLIGLFAVEILAVMLLLYFEADLRAAFALILFAPLLMSAGGNAGLQATSTLARAFAIGETAPRNIVAILWHELGVGMIFSIVLSVLIAGAALLLGLPYPAVAAISLGLFGVVLWSNLIGALLPSLVAQLKFDSALLSAPVVSTLLDVTSVAIYLTIAQVVLSRADWLIFQ